MSQEFSAALYLIPFSLALLTTAVATPVVRLAALRLGLVANPSNDRWHDRPTALLGGVAIVLGVCVAVAVMRLLDFSVGASDPLTGVVIAGAIMFATGVIDDLVLLRPITKLGLETLSALSLISFGVVFAMTPWPLVNGIVTVVWFIGITNAVNLIDNMDGVAPGVAALAALFFAAALGIPPTALGILAMGVAGAATGFLPYNFRPASIFMGDGGSLFLGAVLAGLGAAASQGGGSLGMLVPLAVLVVPLFDTTLVTFNRVGAGRSILAGGRDHTSHRLVTMGLSEAQTALTLFALAIVGGLVALTVEGGTMVSAWSLALFAVALVVLGAYLSPLHLYASKDEIRFPARNGRWDRPLEIVVDAAALALAYVGAFLIVFGGRPPAGQLEGLKVSVVPVVVCTILGFGIVGAYRRRWHRWTKEQYLLAARGIGLGTLLAIAYLALFLQIANPLPPAVLLAFPIVAGVFLTGVRLLVMALEGVRGYLRGTHESRVFLYRVTAGAAMALRHRGAAVMPVGVLDEDVTALGELRDDLPVLGSPHRLHDLVRIHHVSGVVVDRSRLADDELLELRNSCRAAGIDLMIVPPGLSSSSSKGDVTDAESESILLSS